MKKTTDKLNLAQRPNVSKKTRKKAVSLIFSSIASLIVYYGVGATNIPMLQMGVMVAYMIAFGGGVFLAALLTFFGCMSSVTTGNTGIVTTFGRVEDYTLEADSRHLSN